MGWDGIGWDGMEWNGIENNIIECSKHIRDEQEEIAGVLGGGDKYHKPVTFKCLSLNREAAGGTNQRASCYISRESRGLMTSGELGR